MLRRVCKELKRMIGDKVVDLEVGLLLLVYKALTRAFPPNRETVLWTETSWIWDEKSGSWLKLHSPG